jgi:aryl-alcohol dehydrogenase-like predicted oxidoreductase
VTAYADLVRDGKVRHVGLSNFTPERTEAWIATAQTLGGPLPVALQPNYSLVHRNDVEDDLMPLAATHGLGIIPYSSLAGGFLTGKYRSTTIAPGASPRAPGATRFVTPQGLAIIDTLARIGSAHGASATAVALAWLRAQPQVVAPLASASRVAQVPDLLAGGLLELSPDEVAELSSVSAWTPA